MPLKYSRAQSRAEEVVERLEGVGDPVRVAEEETAFRDRTAGVPFRDAPLPLVVLHGGPVGEDDSAPPEVERVIKSQEN